MVAGNLHPLIVHFPIVLLMLYPLFVLLATFWKKESKAMEIVGLSILLLGLLAMGVASETGEGLGAAVKAISAEVYQAYERHETLAGVSMGLGVFAIVIHSLFFGLKYFLPISFVQRNERILLLIVNLPIAILLAVAVSLTGSAGGTLTHKYQVGAFACLEISHPLEGIVDKVLPMEDKLQIWKDRYANKVDMTARETFEALCGK